MRFCQTSEKASSDESRNACTVFPLLSCGPAFQWQSATKIHPGMERAPRIGQIKRLPIDRGRATVVGWAPDTLELMAGFERSGEVGGAKPDDRTTIKVLLPALTAPEEGP